MQAYSKAELFEIKDGANGFDVIGSIERVPRQHKGWESVTFETHRYQVFGGIRNNRFIDIANPIKQRSKHNAKLSNGSQCRS